MISLENVTLSHRGLPVLRATTLRIDRGETVVLTGETGSGKTSLIRALHGDLPIDSGEIIVDGVALRDVKRRKIPALRRRMGVIFQDDKLLEDRSVYDNIRFALAIRMDSARDVQRRALEILAELGMSHVRSSMPAQLSGGEAQRIGVARALANDPAIVLADEPTGDLDPATAAEILRYIAGRRSSDSIILIATHDPARALEAFPGARRWHLAGARVEEISV